MKGRMKERVAETLRGVVWILFFINICEGAGDGVVTSLTPSYGSLNGETRLTIYGRKFSADQFTQNEDPNVGNKVYLVSESDQEYPCPVFLDGCTETQIMCFTPKGMKVEDYYVKVVVDGEAFKDEQLCGGEPTSANCTFKPHPENTPTIATLYPRSGKMGETNVTMTGLLYTDRYGSNVAKATNGKLQKLLRVYVGPKLCEVKVPGSDSDAFYGLALDGADSNYGTLKCKTMGTSVGCFNASFIVDPPYGRSLPEVQRVMENDKICMFTGYTDITNISHANGSKEGGLLQTICGNNFDNRPPYSLPRAYVGDTECIIREVVVDGCITCEVAPDPESTDSSFPGNRGTIFETWTNVQINDISNIDSVRTRTSSQSGYNKINLDETYFFDVNNTMDNYVSKMTTFYSPLHDGHYQFFLYADDGGKLFIDNEAVITSEQEWAASSIRTLESSRRYLLEVVHFDRNSTSVVHLKVKYFNTSYTSAWTNQAVQDRQAIVVTSTVTFEEQEVEFTRFTGQTSVGEKQTVQVNTTGQFRFGMYGVYTGPLTTTMDEDVMKNAIKALPIFASEDSISVVRKQVQNPTYEIVISSPLGNFPNFEVVKVIDNPPVQYTVTEDTPGVPNLEMAALSFAGVISDRFSVSSLDASKLEAAANSLFKAKCPAVFLPSTATTFKYVQDFEGDSVQFGGRRVKDTEPFCGRYSLKDPYRIYKKLDEESGITLSLYGKLCFAYKGYLQSRIRVAFSYKASASSPTDYDTRNILHNFETDSDTESVTWYYTCIDVYAAVKAIYPDIVQERLLEVNVYSLSAEQSGYVDAVVIGQDITTDDPEPNRLRLAPALPNGALIREVTASLVSGTKYKITLKPYECGTGFPLFGIANGAVTAGQLSYPSSSVTQKLHNENGVFTAISRSRASPETGGALGLRFKGRTKTNLNISSEAADFARDLESLNGIGSLSVTRDGDCANFNLTVTFLTLPGDQEQMEVSASSLTGSQPQVSIVTEENGGLFYDPLPGGIVRTVESKPQVSLYINDILTACSGDCSFQWLSAKTPTVTSTTPTEGTLGTSIVIGGTGFDTDPTKNTVTIGNVTCTVTAATATSITCDAGNGPLGEHKVMVNVDGKGYAKHSSGNVMFEFTAALNDISPTSCSLGGGINLTITGHGFKNGLSVTINSEPCPVISIGPSQIVCTVPPKLSSTRRRKKRSGGTYSVQVTYGSTNLQYPGFEYSTSLTAVISSVTPSTISVIGGRLTISGQSFTTTTGTVYVGPVEATVVSWTDAQIVADVRGVPAGTHNLRVMAQYGLATDSSWILPDIYANLTVLNVYPLQGSIQGGTKLTVTGTGFGTNDTLVDVTVGDVECDVETLTDTQIVCEIGYAGTNHYVTNQGTHPEFGKTYAWDPNYVNAKAGDTLNWSWETSQFLAHTSISVIEVESPSAKVAKAGGFRSASSSNGNYSRLFATVGEFYVWSGFVDANGIRSYSGTINVQSATSRIGEIRVKVADIESLYRVGDAANPSDSSQCQAITTKISTCSDNPPTGGSSDKFNFEYWTCSTPTVSSIDVSNATVKTSITISGTGLSTSLCQNEVSFGDNRCTVNSLNASSVTCTLDKSGEPDLGVLHRLAVKVRNRGNALIEITPTAALQIVPNIESISPTVGSRAGGARITITGFGFGGSPLVEIGGVTSNILNSSYTEIICESPPSTSEAERDIGVKAYFNGNHQVAKCETGTKTCKYTYANAYTPTVTAREPDIISGSTTVTITGTSLGSTSEQTVMIGGVNATVTFASATLLKANIANAPVGENDIIVRVRPYGEALGNLKIDGAAVINSPIVPSSGSIHGGTRITINGNGFVTNNTNVTLGDSLCANISTTLSKITCETEPHAAASVSVSVTSNGISYPTASYSFSDGSTPTITSLSPQSGIAGSTLTISGSNLDGGQVTVSLDGADCAVTASSSSEIKCTLGNHTTASVPVSVHVAGKGLSNSDVNFEYTLSLSGISRDEGSLAGGQTLVVSGTGFDNSTVVTICDKDCTLIVTTSSEYTCRTPSNTAQTCSVSASLNGVVKTLENSYTYNAALTPTISGVTPTRGGTGGGTLLSISGSGFSTQSLKRSIEDDISVLIDGAECDVTSVTDTEIECVTGSHWGSVDAKVEVHKSGNGIANEETPGDADFGYIDVWSSIYTWGGESLPEDDDFIVIPAGMTLLLDTDTPVLSFLLIQGGKLIFDEKDVELKSKVIMITDGGLLQVGTESEPFQHKGIITMYGHPKDKELPIYGAKVLAVRNGTLDLHGIEVPLTWTRLASTATAGSTELELQQAVDWNAGDEIVIASTGGRHSQSENEKKTIASISADKRTLTLDSALEANHWGTWEDFDGTTVEFRAEVGLLTHNVLFRGNTNPQWEDVIEECEEGFDTGEFVAQTCFQGRFGEEMGSSEFGAMILVHAPVYDTHEAQARISYTEVTFAGQAFRLGRYPIHFHLNGDMSTSYVRGCGIHKTFNRAVNIHGTHNTLVEKTVIYNIMGGAFFLEDGIETGNTFQYNLAVFVRESSSLLNDDITPASYWVTNPNNTIQHNAAAGGTHFGFWYRMHDHPEGPSHTETVCPVATPLGTFFNNSAHSFGWFGLWIFPDYFPKKNPCSGTEVEPAVFDGLYAWNNEKGAESVNSGALQMKNFVLVQNQKAGYEGKIVDGTVRYNDSAPLIRDSLIVARTTEIPDPEQGWTKGGIIFPYGSGFRAADIKFVSFADSSCAALRWTRIDGTCKDLCGGYMYQTEGLSFVDSSQKAVYEWESEGTIFDKDGTATGNANWAVVPTTGMQPPACLDAPDFSRGIPASMCPPPYNKWRRFSFNQVSPKSLEGMNFLITSQYGTTSSPFAEKRITHGLGWSLALLVGETYTWGFEHAPAINNISFNGVFEHFEEGEYIFMEAAFQLKPDRVSLDGGETEVNETEGGITSDSNHGDWSWDSTNNKMKFMVRGEPGFIYIDRHVRFTAYKCYYENCIPPPDQDTLAPATERPEDFDIWDDTTLWNTSDDSFVSNTGGSYGVPADYNDVRIVSDTWVVVNLTTTFNKLGKLLLEGVLEFFDTPGAVYEIEADFIIIKGGRLIIGWPNDAFDGLATIILRGNHSSPYHIPGEGPILGSKAIGVFGGLDLFGRDVGLTWTELATTATAGSSTIVLADQVSWSQNDEIVIGPTGFDPWQTEARKIVSVAADNKTLTLNSSLSYPHIAHHEILENGQEIKVGAAVGVLSRRIKVVGQDYDGLYQESYGARVLVGLITQYGQAYTGYARLSNVEFYHTGQQGFTDVYDPRYSLAYLTTGDVSEVKPSFVTKCSFHNGFSPAIGAFGTGGLNITDNVIYGPIGDGIKTISRDTRLIGNAVVLPVSEVTYQDRYEVYDYESNAGIQALTDTISATGLILQDNLVTGSERIAFHVPPLDCDDTSDNYKDNKAYANVLGGAVITYHDAITQTSCAKISGFTVWKTNGFGLYYQHDLNLVVEDNLLIENINGLFPIVLGPNPLKHEYADKSIHVRNTTFVGETNSFDCSTDVTPLNDANYELSSKARPSWLPNRGMAGLMLPGFYKDGNGLPTHPWIGIMSYPAIGGLMTLNDVTFAKYTSNACTRNYAISTNYANDDGQHPIESTSASFIDGDMDSLVYYHQPNYRLINSADCVDMDCDGKKKAMIKDLDGTLLGHAGSVIPNSAFEWDGNPRHGLGDYRIPKSMLTAANGDRIDIDTIISHKGIIGTDNCEYRSSWQAYECNDDLNYEMLIVESMDADTETRRLSPVALLGDGYIDLINGPQDHGWCSGYTCRLRLSTFMALVATDKEYLMHFTSKTPDNMRYRLLNVASNEGIKLKVWYAGRSRLDVYVDGVLKRATNVELDNEGRYITRMGEGNEFEPQVANDTGTNFFDKDSGELKLIIKGPQRIDVETQKSVIVTFGLPDMTVDDFFGDNIVGNLAAFLNIPVDKIKVVNAVSASGSRRRKRSTGAGIEVEIEISDEPKTDENATVTFPIDYESLTEMAANIVNECQVGNISELLNVTGNCVSVRIFPSDPDIDVIEYSAPTPDHLFFNEEPVSMYEGVPLQTQPKLRAADVMNNVVTELGTTEFPWQLTASLRPGTGHADAVLSGNVSVTCSNGWFNFTNLIISRMGTGYILDFNVSYPSQANTFYIASNPFDVPGRSLKVNVFAQSDGNIVSSAPFSITFDLQDLNTEEVISDIAWRGHTWTAEASLLGSSPYAELGGLLTLNFDASTGRAMFPDLTVTGFGIYYIQFRVTSDPADFTLTLNHKVNIKHPSHVDMTIEDTDEVQVKFDEGFYELLTTEDKQNEFEQMILTLFANLWPDIYISSGSIQEGSIVVTFVISGTSSSVNSTAYSLCDSIYNQTSYSFDGNNLTLSPYLTINGEVYYGTKCGEKTQDEQQSSDEGMAAYLIAIIVIVSLLVVAVVILVIWKVSVNKTKSPSQVFVKPLGFNKKEAATAKGNHYVGFSDKQMQDYLFNEQSFTSLNGGHLDSHAPPTDTNAPPFSRNDNTSPFPRHATGEHTLLTRIPQSHNIHVSELLGNGNTNHSTAWSTGRDLHVPQRMDRLEPRIPSPGGNASPMLHRARTPPVSEMDYQLPPVGDSKVQEKRYF